MFCFARCQFRPLRHHQCDVYIFFSSNKTNHACASYVNVILTEGFRIFFHHVGQVPPANVELLHLLLDELQTQFFRPCGR